MAAAIPVPKHPTHAVQHIDNWDGEKNVTTSFAFMHEGSYYHHENGNPLLAYVGDEILREWPLTEPSSEDAAKYSNQVAWLEQKLDTANELLVRIIESGADLNELFDPVHEYLTK